MEGCNLRSKLGQTLPRLAVPTETESPGVHTSEAKDVGITSQTLSLMSEGLVPLGSVAELTCKSDPEVFFQSLES